MIFSPCPYIYVFTTPHIHNRYHQYCSKYPFYNDVFTSHMIHRYPLSPSLFLYFSLPSFLSLSYFILHKPEMYALNDFKISLFGLMLLLQILHLHTYIYIHTRIYIYKHKLARKFLIYSNDIS